MSYEWIMEEEGIVQEEGIMEEEDGAGGKKED
jgi:hypothetical protein